MSQAENETGWKIEGRSLSEVMDAALRRLVLNGEGASAEKPSFGLVFTGEGASPEDALAIAMDDIREQCLAQGGVPIEVETSGVMATDAGTRIWGTVTAVPGTAAIDGESSITVIRVREGEDGGWTLTTMTE